MTKPSGYLQPWGVILTSLSAVVVGVGTLAGLRFWLASIKAELTEEPAKKVYYEWEKNSYK